MSPVTSLVRLLVVPGDKEGEAYLCTDGASIGHSSERLLVIDGVTLSDISHESQLGSWHWCRLYENVYTKSKYGEEKRAELIAQYFDLVAIEYFDQIELSRNLDCYEFCFDVAKNVRGTESCNLLVDVGCGPGTILKTTIPDKVSKVAGVDISKHMESLAAKRGMIICGPQGSNSHCHDAQIALSVYMMHFRVGWPRAIDVVHAALGESGVWVMNFHKGLWVEEFCNIIEASNRFDTERMQSETRFGSVLALSKRG